MDTGRWVRTDLLFLQRGLAGLRAAILVHRASPLSYAATNPLGVVGIILGVGALPDMFFRHLLIPRGFAGMNLIVDVLEIAVTLWLCGIYATMVAMPHELDAAEFHVRLGALAEARVPRTDIVGVTPFAAVAKRACKRADREGVFLTVPSTPFVRIDLAAEVCVARYPFVRPVRARRLYVATDAPAQLAAALRMERA